MNVYHLTISTATANKAIKFNLKYDVKWYQAYSQLYTQFKNNYFDNNKYKPNKYEIYLDKYFQPKFEISYYLFILLEFTIYFYLRRIRVLIHIDLHEKHQMNCFYHCLNPRFCLVKGYNSLYPIKDINPFYASIAHHVADFGYLILAFESMHNKNSPIASLARSRLRVTFTYYLKTVLDNMEKEQSESKTWYHQELVRHYHRFAEMCVLLMPLARLSNTKSPHEQLCKYVKRFILLPALKGVKHHQLCKCEHPPLDIIQRMVDITKYIIWCYYLIGNDKKCEKYFIAHQYWVNQVSSHLKIKYNISSSLTVMQVHWRTLEWYTIFRRLKCDSSVRLILFESYINHELISLYGLTQELIDHKQYNLVDQVLTQDITNSDYVGWRNLALQKQCAYCYNKTNILKKCKGCKKVCYCSKLCQRRHWVFEHKIKCQKCFHVEV